MYAVGTGLRNDNVRHELRPLLKNPLVTDEELLVKLNEAVAEESEHISKVGLRKKASVNAVLESEPPSRVSTYLEAQIQEIKAKLDKINTIEQPSSMKYGNPGGNYNGHSPKPLMDVVTWYRCAECNKSNDPFLRCNHCFKCGSADHQRADCPITINRNAPVPPPSTKN